jgi:uncharacterized membrane protein HdeD (DUF308 family)
MPFRLSLPAARLDAPLLDDATRLWWSSFLRGATGLLFGPVAAFWPDLTVVGLALWWGSYAALRALVGAMHGVRSRWWTMVAASMPLLIGGLVALTSPGIEADALRELIGAVGIATGLLELLASLDLRRVLVADETLALTGTASITASIFLLTTPTYGVLPVAWLIGTLAILDAVLSFGMATTLRDNRRRARRVAERALGAYRMPPPRRSASQGAAARDQGD